MDDLEVVVSSRRVRRQIKFSKGARALKQGDFTNVDSSLRIDHLVRTSIAEGPDVPVEYRLCATWTPPTANDPLTAYLRPTSVTPTIAGTQTKTFRLDPDALWPIGELPKWRLLAGNASLSRDHFVGFCKSFVVELAMPRASHDLFAPGPLERALLDVLRTRVGVGVFPNEGLRAEDFAGHAIILASRARAGGEAFTPADVVAKLQLKTDYGHVAQAFPLDASVEIPRDDARQELLETALAGGLQLVIGPPGAGKSWQLTQLARDLTARDAVVARHYCYLRPLDDEAGLRIKSDVFFGNLIYEMTSQVPDLAREADIGFGADFDRLQRLITVAGESKKRVVLIVDGLDHIARVLSDAPSVAPESTDIIEKLATLDIPDSVSVVVGSQPGDHLWPLQKQWVGRVVERRLAPWSVEDLVALARAHGLDEALRSLELHEDEISSTLLRLAERAAGNPLYARALTVDLITGAADGDIGSPLAWLASTEGVADGVVAYYRYLYRKVQSDGRVIADLLGVVEFSVTRRDLEEMAGWCAAEVAPALRVLRPVLVEASGQGGVRVFHESFRRFIRERLLARDQTVATVLSPVIEWLQNQGAFADARAFRFLLPALVRAGRDAEVWQYVKPSFVRDAVAAGHARDAIVANVMLAADVARRDRDWAMLVRCLELHRAAYTTFSPSQNQWEPYIAAYLEIFGRDALAERLRFDGRPTLDHDIGLYACALVDAAGGVAPWSAYDSRVEEGDTIGSDPLTDTGAFLTMREAREQHEVRANLRCDPPVQMLWHLYRYLAKHGAERKPLVIRGVARSAAEVLGIRDVADLTLRATGAKTCRLAQIVRAHLLLGVAEAAHAANDADLARMLATRAITWASDAETALRCLELDASMPVTFLFAIEPSEIPIAVAPDEHLHEAENVRRWVSAVRLHARRVGGNDAVLDRERARITGRGWYRSWLRFIIDLAVVEAAAPATDDAVTAAFATLEADAHRFLGKPRACDLWPIRLVIEESLVRGLHMLRTIDAWSSVLRTLARVVEGTNSTIHGEDGGAISTGTLIDVLVPHASHAAWGNIVLHAIEERVSAHPGTHYPFLAEFAIGVARARMAAGDADGAHNAWINAATFLTAYGWRKDGTFYELSQSFRILGDVAPSVARAVAASVQEVADAVELHTDGKGTKYCLNDWLAALLRLAPAAGGLLVARANAEADDVIGWKTAESLRLVVDAYVGAADPLLLEHLLRTVEIGDSSMEVEEREVDRRFAPLHAFGMKDARAAAEAYRVAYAALADDARAKRGRRARAHAAMESVGVLELPALPDDDDAEVDTEQPPSMTGVGDSESALSPEEERPMPSFGTSLPEIYRMLRTVARGERHDASRGVVWGDAAAALVARLHEMLVDNRGDDVVRVLLFFARDAGVQRFSSEPHPLAMVAAMLDERGDASHAAVAYMLAYTSTRSEWLDPFGGSKHRALVLRATELDGEAVRGLYADQVFAAMRANEGYVDLSADVLQRLKDWGDVAGVMGAYYEIFAVIDGRTPQPRLRGRLPRLDDDTLRTDWSLDEVAVALILARTSDPRVYYKMAALQGFVDAVRRGLACIARPLAWWLERDVPRMSVLLVLEALVQAEQAPFELTRAVASNLEALARTTSSWLTRVRASTLLERVGSTPRPRTTASQSDVPPLPPYDANIRNAASEGSWPALREVRPLFPEIVELAERTAYAKLPSLSERRDRAKAMWGLHLDTWPPTPAILYEREVLFEALDDALAELMRTANDDVNYDGADPGELERALLPDLWFHIGRAASRVARPNWQRASAVVNGEVRDELSVVDSNDDPRYAGWARLALVEHEAVMPEQSSILSRPERGVTAWAAAVAWPHDRAVPEGVWPFTQLGEIPELLGPLAAADVDGSWLGHPWRLEPPYTLVWDCGLERSTIGEALMWRDATGEVAIAVRTWRVIRHDARSEPTTFEGCDLIMRPDIVERLRLLHDDLREMHVTDDVRLPIRV